MTDGLSSRTLAEITRLELSRDHLAPGGVSEAVRCWKAHVRQPLGALWRDGVRQLRCPGPQGP
ncbi:hypothetical protein [Streptomyces sp. JH34]|uniref:hypothetical protein n=1 Tax=Streptomyces sp. JH34 TaxID=2793633 RepID=UPI0023F679E8|nr:hypothetical protein [Streptomyces sp. JH34]MDF6020809.1 hypothetical protein [Streptomyces sp. JH34]